jgi:hypothetical protein
MVYHPQGEQMNQRDRENLNFLLTIDQETFDDWVSQADDDDLEYALDLIREARLELVAQQFEIMDGVNHISSIIETKNLIERLRNKR